MSRKNAMIALGAGLLLAAPAAFVVAVRRPSVPAGATPGAEQAETTSVGGSVLRAVSPSPSSPNTPPKAPGLPDFSHVFVIVMENREYGSVIGSPAAPYINSLARS